jgi:hypothetical protein
MTGNRMRRAIGIHMIPHDAQFSDRPGGYIYRRYQRTGDPTLDESFFPVLWSETGHRTDWIDAYCETGRRLSASDVTTADDRPKRMRRSNLGEGLLSLSWSGNDALRAPQKG